MTRQCVAPGCIREVRSHYGRLCPKHNAHKRAHGAVDQLPVRSPELKPYLAKIAGWRKTMDLEFWKAVDGQWAGRLMPAVNRQFDKPFCRTYQVKAATELRRIDAGVADHFQITDTVMAMFLLYEDQRDRFVNDQSFKYQLGRMVRNLSPTAKGTTFNVNTGTIKRWPKRFAALPLFTLGTWLVETYSRAGLTLARTQWAAERAEAEQRKRYETAVDSLTAAVGLSGEGQ